MPTEVVHTVILIATVALAFLFPKSGIAQYDLQVFAFLFVVLFIGKRVLKTGKLLDSVIFTFVIFALVNTTGGLDSPFFFLLYFLLFSITLFLEPVTSIPLSLSAVVFFLLFFSQEQGLKPLLSIFSLVFLTPFALFMGKEYEKNLALKKESSKFHQDTYMMLSLMVKNHMKIIKDAAQNFVGDHQLREIDKSAREVESVIEKFEKNEDFEEKK